MAVFSADFRTPKTAVFNNPAFYDSQSSARFMFEL